MKKMLLVGSALSAALLGLSAAQAQDTDFIVANNSDQRAVSFQTAETRGWSRDWIPGDSIGPGEQFSMRFNVAQTDCNIPTRVVFEDGSTFERVVDYCETAMLKLGDDTVEAEPLTKSLSSPAGGKLTEY